MSVRKIEKFGSLEEPLVVTPVFVHSCLVSVARTEGTELLIPSCRTLALNVTVYLKMLNGNFLNIIERSTRNFGKCQYCCNNEKICK